MEDIPSIRIGSRKRAREDEVLDQLDTVVSAEAKRLRDELLLGFFDDTDPKPAAQDLDSHMWSFQEEISTASLPTTEEVVDLTSESGRSEELGYLIGSSDDLGLPPSFRNDVIDDLWSREAELAGAPYGWSWGLEGHVDVYDDGMGAPSYGSYDGDEGYEYVAYDGGLFGYSDIRFDLSDDLSDLSWQSGS